MIYYVLALTIALSTNTLCMEWPGLPQEVIKYIGECNNVKSVSYSLDTRGAQEVSAFPWTISPVLLKYCTTATSIDKDLNNPEPNTQVLHNAQLWQKIHNNEIHYRLSEDFRRTDDRFYTQDEPKRSTWLFDGINALDTAVLCHQYNADNYTQEYYKIFVLKQAGQRGKEVDHEQKIENIKKEGLLRSLMLEYECNRIMYSVHQTRESCYKLFVDYIDEHSHMPIATCVTEKLFVKTVPLGKDTYLGITDEGLLYSIWLDGKKNICSTPQTFSSSVMRFKDISVDRFFAAARGFYPRVAFLTHIGEMFVTDLDEFQKPTLLYVGKIDSIDTVKRFFYSQGKLLVFDGEYATAYEYKDNFDILYGCALLRKFFSLREDDTTV